MSASNYTYTLNGSTVTPSGDWNFEYRKNKGQIFWRVHIVGEFTFKGDDYDTIMGMSDCGVLEFKIYCQGSEIWEGEFKHPYGWETLDTDKCLLKGTPEVVDEYSCIMSNYETEYHPFLAIGGVQADLHNCGGAKLRTLPFGYYMIQDSTIATNNHIYEMLDNMGCIGNPGDPDLVSSFFCRSNFPDGTTVASLFGAGNNYVTGAANRLEYIIWLTNTSLRNDFGGSFCDQNDYFSFKDYETFLRNAFNAYWYIDENGDIRFEHISYFLPGFAASSFGSEWKDLTTLIAAQTGKSHAYRRNKYKPLSDRLFDQEVWKWQHYEGTEGTIPHQSDFEGVPVFYGANAGEKSDCVPGDYKEKEWHSPNFWADIYWAYQLQAAGTPDTINCPGFCFVDIDTSPSPPQVRCENGVISGAARQNGHCCNDNLLERYHTWNRIFLSGDMNSGNVTTFDSEIKKKLQQPISFPICCLDEFEPIAGITTEMGTGLLYSAEINQNSITVELEYD